MMQEHWDRQRQEVQAHEKDIAKILILAFSEGRGNNKIVCQAIQREQEKLGIDITSIDPYIIIGNQHIFSQLDWVYTHQALHSGDDIEMDAHVIYATALADVFRCR
ncbi:MAG: hypothetical protein HZA34_03680 [Candidatus Pacebacteria bacterium]|nr:hypothetical protein [Candidatus Paceibacterota bacterium]